MKTDSVRRFKVSYGNGGCSNIWFHPVDSGIKSRYCLLSFYQKIQVLLLWQYVWQLICVNWYIQTKCWYWNTTKKYITNLSWPTIDYEDSSLIPPIFLIGLLIIWWTVEIDFPVIENISIYLNHYYYHNACQITVHKPNTIHYDKKYILVSLILCH